MQMGQRCLLILLFSTLMACSQDHSGHYVSAEANMAWQLGLVQQNSQLSGDLNADGETWSLLGQSDGDSATGFLSAYGETMRFNAQFSGEELVLTIIKQAGAGQPETHEILRFTRISEHDALARSASVISENLVAVEPGQSSPAAIAKASPPERKPPPAEPAPEVAINNQVLSAEQIQGLAEIYGMQPLPGNYWYDDVSGLYGVEGYPAFGFMLPGHPFASMSPSASSGNTGVFVNGRQLPQSEWVVWSQLLGYPIQMGRYWLDSSGNAGYEGNPMPTDNLYLAAQRNAYAGGGAAGSGGGGDNTWSTRFSAGNYDQGNSRGYVSVPGHGPIGYGF